jgi:hypothetical protein
MLRIVRVVGWLALSVLVCFSLPNSAQPTSSLAKPSGPSSYDVSTGIALNGTVSSALKKLGRGMIRGDHLLFETTACMVDHSLANSALGIEP